MRCGAGSAALWRCTSEEKAMNAAKKCFFFGGVAAILAFKALPDGISKRKKKCIYFHISVGMRGFSDAAKLS